MAEGQNWAAGAVGGVARGLAAKVGNHCGLLDVAETFQKVPMQAK